MTRQAKKPRIFVTKGGDEIPYTFVSQADLIPLDTVLDDKKPSPPLEEVDTAAGIQLVPNEAHPEYKEALELFSVKHKMYMIACVIELGVDLEITEEQLADIARSQKKLARLMPDSGDSWTKDFNIYNYVKTICPSIDEQAQFSNIILGINTPTLEQVQKQLDTFRPGVPGSTNNVDQDASIGDTVAVG